MTREEGEMIDRESSARKRRRREGEWTDVEQRIREGILSGMVD